MIATENDRSSFYKRILDRASDERGFTLTELLVSSVLLVIVVSATLAVLDTNAKIVPKDTARQDALRTQQVGLLRMTRELRQGQNPSSAPTLPTTAGNTISVLLSGTSPATRATWDCTKTSPTNAALKACYRYASTTTTSDPETQVGVTGVLEVDRLQNGTTGHTTSVFTPLPASPASSAAVLGYTVQLEVPSAGDRTNGYAYTSILKDAFYLRNQTAATL